VGAWLTSSGIDADMGGIASVTRSCLAALAGASGEGVRKEPLAVDRFLGLYSAQPSGVLADRASSVSFEDCGGSRLRFLARVARQVVGRPDLVLYEHVDLAQCQVLLPKRLRRPWALWGHGIELWRPLPRLKKKALLEADLLLFNSAFTREKAGSLHPEVLDRPYRVVPLCREGGRDNKPASPATSEPPPGKPSILTVGRLVADRPKGHLEILETLPRVIDAVPHVQWHVVGDGPWRSELTMRVRQSPARDHVTLHGFVEEAALTELYRTSRVFAMPSHGEGFGLVYAEAMAHGLPCVGSTRDAAPEVIAEGGTCVDLDCPEELAQALLRYLNATPEEGRNQREAALRRSGFFTPERFAHDLRQALAELR